MLLFDKLHLIKGNVAKSFILFSLQLGWLVYLNNDQKYSLFSLFRKFLRPGSSIVRSSLIFTMVPWKCGYCTIIFYYYYCLLIITVLAARFAAFTLTCTVLLYKDSARFCMILQDSARFCKIINDFATL